MIHRNLPSILIIFLLISCTEEDGVVKGAVHSPESDVSVTDESVRDVVRSGHGRKLLDDVVYEVSVLSALEFIARKGERVSDGDRGSLSEEQVVLLDISLSEDDKTIWESSKIVMSEEALMNYLVGSIGNDFTIDQGGIERHASGVGFEGRTGSGNAIRVQFFFQGLQKDKPMKAYFYDRITGSGLIKFGINEE